MSRSGISRYEDDVCPLRIPRLTDCSQAPIGSWPKDPRLSQIGQFSQAAMEQDLEGFVLYMANIVLGWSRDQVLVYCSQLRREMRSSKFHPYCRLRVVYGRKPER